MFERQRDSPHGQPALISLLDLPSSAAEKGHGMGTLIVAVIAIPALFVALMHIRYLRHIAWLKARVGTV
jgi:murein endopeptidase